MKIIRQIGVTILMFAILSTMVFAAWNTPKNSGDAILALDWNAMVQAIWDGSSGDVYRTSGSVGIGTSDPNYLLHVHNSGGTSAIQLTSSASGTSGTDGIRIQIGTNAEIRNYEDSSFTIIGGGGTTSDLNFQTTSEAGVTGADMHFLVGNAGATEAMTILNDGKVGIGTTAPIVKLDIKDENILIGSDFNGDRPYDGSTVRASLLVITKDESDKSVGMFSYTGATANTLVFGADSTGFGGYSVTKMQFKTAPTTTSVFANADTNLFMSNTANIFNSGNNDIDFIVKGGTDDNLLVIDASTDRVGIGTTAPSYQLHLSHASSPTVGLTDVNNGGTFSFGVSAGQFRITDETVGERLMGANAGLVIFNPLRGNNDFEVRGENNNVFFVDASTDRVGIGTNAPSQQLHIKSSTPVILIEGTGNTARFRLQSANSASWDNILAGNNSFLIFDSWNSLTPMTIEQGTPSYTLYLDSNGRIGIGTNSPQKLLHVQDAVGRFKYAGSGPQYRAGMDLGQGLTFQIERARGTLASPINLEDNDEVLLFDIYGYTNGAYTQQGKWGLQMINSSGNEAKFFFSGIDEIELSAESLVKINTYFNDADTIINGDTSEIMRIDASSGNVGIGTTVPGKKLEVGGTFQADDYYSGDGTQGYTGSCADGTSLTVKDGLITGCS